MSYVVFSRCVYTSNEKDRIDLKLIVYDIPIQVRKKSDGGIRTNETEGITTQNIVLKEIFEIGSTND